jgi:receptor protein-tyrosine kinase
MSLIEQAAKRLEQLRNAGVDLGEGAGSKPHGPGVGGGQGNRRLSELEARLRDEQESKERASDAGAAARHPLRGEPPHSQPPPAEHSRRITIDLALLAAAGLVTPDAPRSQIADEFRVIKRPLLANAQRGAGGPGAAPNMIMVTSALAGEGKTFSAVNLAMSLAMELDTTVLLVDADVSNSSLLPILGLPQTKGLLDVLTDDGLDLSRVILRTNVAKLALLPAGTPHPRATELLASDTMTRLVAQMATRYPDRVIVFDSPPLLLTTESRVLAAHMGQILVVVEADKTTAGALKQALDTVESCPIVLTMLNKTTASGMASYYGYGYRYSPSSGEPTG